VKASVAARWAALVDHFRQQAKVVDHFRHADAHAVARMWTSQRNEDQVISVAQYDEPTLAAQIAGRRISALVQRLGRRAAIEVARHARDFVGFGTS
jgi:hypothetical protein